LVGRFPAVAYTELLAHRPPLIITYCRFRFQSEDGSNQGKMGKAQIVQDEPRTQVNIGYPCPVAHVFTFLIRPCTLFGGATILTPVFRGGRLSTVMS
jgi:hypothetical protein